MTQDGPAQSLLIYFLGGLAGTPTTVLPLGTSFITTALAPILTLFPIVIGPRTFAPAPIITLSPLNLPPLKLDVIGGCRSQ
ncbi:hypothetical protein AN640_07640 [Candidatus Epulonipiscium fishelsonii]|uniref:Uncharacterized protein n=1 Tax=Candidatus Epulonipiscium fishelsonii TaxID=77094 RepID=A0ACC8XFT4_9FIRM|nr:hypothetical protein AN640_07640 [Epulopiscium sp. SCG-D08WGA-EpuloA1]